MADRYHHGDLPNVLRCAAADVIAEKGLGSFSLREVARRAGVSHAAPAHHFGDTTGLLTSLATEAMVRLRTTTEAAITGIDDPVERLEALGRGYVRVGVQYPAHCEIVFRGDLIDTDDADYQAAASAAYAVLLDTVGALAAAENPELPVDDAAKLCWSAMQGLLVLHHNMVRMDERMDREPAELDELVGRFTSLLLEGLRRR